VQKLLIGTHTSNDEQNYLQIVSVKIPLESSKDTKDYKDNMLDDNTTGVAGSGVTNAKQARISIDVQINHQGEVNKARYMPQDQKIIATKTNDGEIDLFDYYKHPKTPVNDEVKPDLRLLGHTQEGYGMEWNPITKGMLLSGSDDCRVCVWDINATSSNVLTQEPVVNFEAHSSIVEDVAWNNFDEFIFSTVGDDKKLKIWDIRDPKRPTNCIEGHVQEIMSVDCSPFDQYLMVTGSADSTVAVGDTRNVKTKLYSLRSHTKDVNNVRFSKMQSNLLASSSHDRRIMVWDLSRFDKPQTEEEKEDGPPELLFVHGGHTDRVSDLSWNLNERLMMASVADDNVV